MLSVVEGERLALHEQPPYYPPHHHHHHHHHQVSPGETVLVHAAASGVGVAAVQLAVR
jgi:NADPH:quinone reductase-like Zn-dependent oxidoreductase